MVSIAAHHAEWLSLLDVSGPFLSVPVLKKALPNGLDAHDGRVAADLRAAVEQWAGPELADGSQESDQVHLAFLKYVLHDVLGFDDDVLIWGGDDSPQWAGAGACVFDGETPVLPIGVFFADTPVDQIHTDFGLETPQRRMAEHLKETGLRVGLVTDGERWTLVSHRDGDNPGFATWWSSLWSEEKLTLQSFRTLLHQDRFLTLAEDESIGALLDSSADDQREITTKLGKQTLEAVEILIRTIDRVDQESGGDLLRQVEQERGIEELYDAAVTVMMRLVFLFYAEESELLPVAEPMYLERYAASSLRERLQALADENGEEVLESNHDAWSRLLATWRAVYGGVEHGEMVLAPYGGSLFDPDRYPFLEGRNGNASWTTSEAHPLRIDNRTVLHLLNALQTLDEGGQRRKLSFRALDVEQIGHIYEGLLDHTAARANGWVLGLSGTGGKEPEVELDELLAYDSEKQLLDRLKSETGRASATNKKWMKSDASEKAIQNFGGLWSQAFSGSEVESKVRPFAKLIREDSAGAPYVVAPGGIYVADSAHRSSTGTHYTPRSLTSKVVRHTLEPLIYTGPVEGASAQEWELRTSSEILGLTVCDPACGSGAFLVEACRYLAQGLLEARLLEGTSASMEDLELDCRRLVAERCLHGVDVNPMACEMAKLSLWLFTSSVGRPFAFLDHAIVEGDSLVGITDVEQLKNLSLVPQDGRDLLSGTLFDIDDDVRSGIEGAARGLERLRGLPTEEIQHSRAKRTALDQVRAGILPLRQIADAVVALAWNAEDGRWGDGTLALASDLAALPSSPARNENRPSPVHWPLAFPGAFPFDAVVGNPPFLGSTGISELLGDEYHRFIARKGKTKGSRQVDLAARFLSRSAALSDGQIGMLVTSSVAEGTNRRESLESEPLIHWELRRADHRLDWPGAAGVVYSRVWLSSDWQGPRILDGREVKGISSSLGPMNRINRGDPVRLAQLRKRCFQGATVWGDGFYLDEDAAKDLLRADPRNALVVKRALGGKDIASRTGQPTGWVVDFGDRELDSAAQFEAPFATLERTVRPFRESLDESKYPRAVQKWWQHFHLREELYGQVRSRGLRTVPVRCRVSNRHIWHMAETDGVFFHDTVSCIAAGDPGVFPQLQSRLHWIWTEAFASRLGHGTRYGARNVFETFPFVTGSDPLREAGEEFLQARSGFLGDSLPLKKFLPGSPAATQAFCELDEAVATALGLPAGRTVDAVQAAWSGSETDAERILDQLIGLNYDWAIDEAARGIGPVVRKVVDAAGFARIES